MLLIWRGWGLMAVLALLLPLASCAGLMDTRQSLALFLAGITLLGGGVVCWIYGRRWNRHVTEHSFFFVPLQYVGLAYMLFGGFMAVSTVVGWIRKGG